jgi:hypothetical protein
MRQNEHENENPLCIDTQRERLLTKEEILYIQNLKQQISTTYDNLIENKEDNDLIDDVNDKVLCNHQFTVSDINMISPIMIDIFMQHCAKERYVICQIIERLGLIKDNYIIDELLDIYNKDIKNSSMLCKSIDYVCNQLDEKNQMSDKEYKIKNKNVGHVGHVACVHLDCNYCLTYESTDIDDLLTSRCRYCIGLKKEKNITLEMEGRMAYRNKIGKILIDKNQINNSGTTNTTNTTNTINNTIININYQNNNNIIINNNFVLTKDRFYFVSFYTFGDTRNEEITRLKYIFTNLMCGQDGKRLFPDELTHSSATTFTVDAALYSIDTESTRPMLNGLLRFKYIKNKSHITPKRLMETNRLTNETVIINTQVTPINIWENKKHHFSKEHITNALENIKKYDYYGSDDDEFLKDSFTKTIREQAI